MKTFPNWLDAPKRLLQVDGNCGLLSVWAIISYFGKRTTVAQLIKTTGFTKKNGVFCIGAASSLAEHGLKVIYQCDKDASPHQIEIRISNKMNLLNIKKVRPTSLSSMLSKISEAQIGLVLYDKPTGDAHFSPLLGMNRRRLILPYETEEDYSIIKLTKAWNRPGILRQALLVTNE